MAYDRIRAIGSSQVIGGLLLIFLSFSLVTEPLTARKGIAFAATLVVGTLSMWKGWRMLRRATPRPPDFFE
jgi:hypothetical protein